MKRIKLYEEFLNEANNMRTLRGFLKELKKEYGPTPTEQSLADFIYNNYEAVTGEDLEDSNPAANDHIADIIAHFRMDGEDFMIAWEDRVNESKFTDYDNNELYAYVKNNPKDKEASKELSKRSKKLKNLSRTDEAATTPEDSKVTVDDFTTDDGVEIKSAEIVGAMVSSESEEEFKEYFYDEYGMNTFTEADMGTLTTYYNEYMEEVNAEETEKEEEEENKDGDDPLADLDI